MRTIAYAANAGATAGTRIILMPPAYAEPEDFVAAGFVDAVRARGLDIDLVFAGLKSAHITERSLDGAADSLVAPAAAHGCRVWLGGISLGGFAALCYASRHAGSLAGLCLLAPYLGSHIITDEVARTGIDAWQPGNGTGEDDERDVWRFIQHSRAGGLTIHVGLGREDRFAARHRILAAALKPSDTDVIPGGHDWPTWHRLWENFLDARFRANP